MSWLNELEYEYRFECQGGHLDLYKLQECDRAPRICQTCGAESQYAGFNPMRMGGMGKVAYEQNGRKAFRITNSDGSVRHVSATKAHYMETGEIKPGYTSGYAEALAKAGRDDLLQTKSRDELVKERAEVSKAKVEMAKAPRVFLDAEG